MNILMANKGQTVSKDLLISKVWGVESSAVDNNVEAYVSFVRKKLAFVGSTVQIETLRRAGYRLIDTASAAADGKTAGQTAEEQLAEAFAGEGAQG